MSSGKHSILRGIMTLAIVIIAAIAAVFALTNLWVLGTQRENIVSDDEAAAANADAIVVLGASVMPNGTPSTILQDRLDTAIGLYKEGVADKLIMSGDGGDASYNEPGAMKMYAVEQGVPSQDVFCDRAGFNTYDSMYRARHIFGAQRIVVVSQSYHLPRALYSANGLGMAAVGVASDARAYKKQAQYSLREIPARTKDFFQTLLRRPADLASDEPVSLDQSGDVTNKYL